MISMGIMFDELETLLEDIEEEGDLFLNEEFMMGIFQGIMDYITPFGKYWTLMFQNKSIPHVGEYQSKVFTFYRKRNKLLSPDDKAKKETSVMIGEMAVTAAKALLSDIWN